MMRPQHLVGWGGRIRTFNLLIQSDPRYRQWRFRIELSRLISELRGGAASEPGTQIWRETGAKRLYDALLSSARCSGTEANNYGQCAIDFPKLARREQPMGFAQPGKTTLAGRWQ